MSNNGTAILERMPPVDLDAERGVLGSIFLHPDACDEVALLLRPGDFYDDAHRKLFEHMMQLHEGGRGVDSTLLFHSLKEAGDFEAVGGAAFIARVIESVANAAHARYYADIVRQKATLRAIIDAGTEIVREGYTEGEDARDTLSRCEQRIFAILDHRSDAQVRPVKSLLHDAMERLEARMNGHEELGLHTGFTEFDKLTGGLHDGELNILAARPSMGKTAMALNIAEHVAMQERQRVLLISLEMSSIELADRMLCSLSRVNGHHVRNGTISNEDRRWLVEKSGELSNSPLHVDDSPSRTVTEIAASARRISRREKDPLRLIVIDYLQLIEPDNPRDPRHEQVSRMTRRLKGLAREMQLPVLCLAQLNRQAEDGKNKEPKLSHLRESGAIEQDADVVMFVHREEYYRRGEEAEQFAGQAELLLRKQRNGPTGDVKLIWRKEYTRFENPAPDRLSEFDAYNDYREPANSGYFD